MFSIPTDSYEAVWAARGLMSHCSPPPPSVSWGKLSQIALVGLIFLLLKIRDTLQAQMGVVSIGGICRRVVPYWLTWIIRHCSTNLEGVERHR